MPKRSRHDITLLSAKLEKMKALLRKNLSRYEMSRLEDSESESAGPKDHVWYEKRIVQYSKILAGL